MADAIDDFVPGELWKYTGDDGDVMVSRNKFPRESEPAFFKSHRPITGGTGRNAPRTIVIFIALAKS
jgi:hypothetical protein